MVPARFSVRQQQGDRAFLEQFASDAPEEHLAQPVMAERSSDDHAGAKLVALLDDRVSYMLFRIGRPQVGVAADRVLV